MTDEKELQSAIERILQMEKYLDEVLDAAKNCPDSIKENGAIRAKIQLLTEYYESPQWLEDYECDERGELPTDLKRGVLAQDTLYDLLEKIGHI